MTRLLVVILLFIHYLLFRNKNSIKTLVLFLIVVFYMRIYKNTYKKHKKSTMNECVENFVELENKVESISDNGCGIMYRIIDKKNDFDSEELFSDDDQSKDSVIYTPKIATKNDTINFSVISLNTPILCSKVFHETTGKAIVPRTPCDLLPFITKTNVLWTSDMETPKSKLNEKSEKCNETIISVNICNRTPHHPESLLNYGNMNANKTDATSPILGGKKRSKRRVKRRILNNVVLDLDTNNEQHSSISSNSDKLPFKTTSSASNEFASYNDIDIKKQTIKECNNLNNIEFKENRKLEESNNFGKNSNSSTQDFFSNASFSSIDRLCSSVIQEEKPHLYKEDVSKININDKSIKIGSSDVKEKTNVSKNVLERVAAIRRNQKSLRRTINAQVIPKDVFTKSARELEFADLKFTKEKKKTLNINNKSLKQISFTKVNFIENETIIEKNKSSVEMDSFSQFVPAEIMDDWNTDNALDNQKENLNFRNLPDFSNIQTLSNSDINFCTAKGKGIIINEEYLQKSMKIYKEIEDEIKSSNDLLNLRKSNAKVISLKHSVNQIRENKNILNTTSYLFNNGSSCINKSLNLDNCNNMIDTLSVNNKNITCENKVLVDAIKNKNFEENVFHELQSNKNKSNNSQSNILQKCTPDFKPTVKNEMNEDTLSLLHENNCNLNKIPETLKIKQECQLDEFLESKFTPESTEGLDIYGFSTAGGKGIKINEEKESYYLEVFNKLSENIQNENCFLNQKKKEQLKINYTVKPLNRASITFNKKHENLIVGSKLNISNNTNLAFSNHDNLDKLNTPSNYSNTLNSKKVNGENYFNPNSTYILKKINQPSTVIHNEQEYILTTSQTGISVKKESFCKIEETCGLIKNDANSKKYLEKEKILNDLNNSKSKQNKVQIEKLKQRLHSCEIKRPERCRSFGGFSVDDAGVTSIKLNKSDPINESFTNQPLTNGLSISQCFDSHSDSWLSKVEISYLNNNKVKSPDLKKRRVEKNGTNEKPIEFLGFSYKECTEIFRRYTTFKKFLKKENVKHNNNIELTIDSGQSISLCNNTSSKQQLLVKYEHNVSVTKNVNESSYILTESKPNICIDKLSDTHELKVKQENFEIEKIEKVIEKRKYVDTDSDTPLSTLKKPRVGSELQGRKLFYDKSNKIIYDEDSDTDIVNQVKNEEVLPSLNVLSPTDQNNKNILEKRVQALLHQEKIIRNKKRMKINIIMGSLLRQRLRNSKNRIPWAKFIDNAVPTARSIEQIKENHPDVKILDVSASNATCYKFLSSDIIGNKKRVSLDVGDGANLIFNQNGHAGVSEFTKAFLAMPGVDPRLLPTSWIENHYKWIIWKLASIDRIHFNTTQLPKMLTPERVIKELKYRYDREIDKAERSALRRILEKDDVATRRMVLCISSIEKTNKQESEKDLKNIVSLSQLEIEATDGWYSIPLTIDSAMANYVSIGKIKEGTKIITYGAELLECQRGYFPLEKPANVSLKIYTNCTRRARWNTKLGYQKNSRPIPVKLRDIVPTGGMVGETTAVAARTYPLLFREKTVDGQSIYRNARSEEKAANAYERTLQLKVDAMYAEAEKIFDSKKRSESDEELENSQMKSTRIDKNNLQRKQDLLKQKLESQILQDLPPPRQVTTVQKIRLVRDKISVILLIWGTSEDSGFNIKEGDTVTVYNSFAMGTRGGELNLTANRITRINKEPLLKLPYPSRICTHIPDIESASFEPVFDEFDTVGIVVSSGAAPYGMKNFEIVSLAHPKPNNSGSSYLSILFWNGLSSFGYQGMLTVGSLVACSNLEWRRNTSWSVPVAYCSEKTVFTCHPRQSHLVKELRILKALVQNPVTYAAACAEEVAVELSKKSQPQVNHGIPGGGTSPWAQSPSGPSVHRRLEKLSQYDCAIDTSPSVVLNDSSDRVKRGFIPVTRKNT